METSTFGGETQLFFFVNQYGWPDGAATAQLLCQVLAAGPGERECVLIQGSSQYSADNGERFPPPAKIIKLRVPSVLRHWPGRKIIEYAVFYGQAAVILVGRPRNSCVVVMTTPPFLNVLAALSKLLRGGHVVSWEMDVYPEILFSTGVLSEHSWFGACLTRMARLVRARTDLTFVLGPCMARLVHRGGVRSGKWVELQNWANGKSLYPTTIPGSEPKLMLLYSGNLGVAHDVETMASALEMLNAESIQFLFAGGGTGLERMKSVRNENVHFQSACAYGELNSVLNSADIGIVTQTEASLGCVVPSKFYGILAAGRGVLYVGPRGSTVEEVIRETGCGWTVALGDAEGMAKLIRELARDRVQVREVGLRARLVFEERFTIEQGVNRFWASLRELHGNG